MRSVRSVLQKHVASAGALEKSELVALLVLVSRRQLTESGTLISDSELFGHVAKSIHSKVSSAVQAPDTATFSNMLALCEKLSAPAALLGRFALAYIYQLASMPSRRLAQDSLQSANKQSTLQKTISFTQLYTPPWVVQYLVQKTIEAAQDIKCLKLIDPACGAGNFLVEAFVQCFDKLTARGQSPEDATKHLLENSLSGCDIDPLGLWVCALALSTLTLPVSKVVFDLQLTCTAPQSGETDSLGSLSANFSSDHPLSQKYDAVVGNPPYLGRKLLDRHMKTLLRKHYPDGHQDLCTAFLIKGLDLLKDGGRLGYITQSSVLFLPTYEKLRRILLKHRLVVIVEAGTQVFPLQTGEKVKSALLVIERANPENHTSVFVDLADAVSKQDGLKQLDLRVRQDHVYKYLQNNFHISRKLAFNYKSPPVFQECLQSSQKLAERAEVRQGLATGDNGRFVKWWWQVAQSERSDRWVPYAKSGGSERWFSPISSLLDWEDDGKHIKQSIAERYPYLNGNVNWVVKNEQFYFRPGLTFSLVNTKQLSVRELPEGCIFDVAGSAVFPMDEQEKYFLLGYLNSSFMAACATALNPTINFQVGDVKALPVIEIDIATQNTISELALSCVAIKKANHSFSDTFEGNPDWVASMLDATDPERAAQQVLKALMDNVQQLPELEEKIDTLVLRAGRLQFGARFDTMTAACARAAHERKVVTPTVQNLGLLARLLVRRMCYQHILTENVFSESEADRFFQCSETTKMWLENTMRCTLFSYLKNEFERDQKANLFNTVRLSVTPLATGAAIEIRSAQPSARAVRR